MLANQSTGRSRSENPRRNGLGLSWCVSLVSLFLVISEVVMSRRWVNSGRDDADMKLSISWLGAVRSWHLAWTATRFPVAVSVTRSTPMSGPHRPGHSSQSQTLRNSWP
jgi:hypothetical protein